MPYLSQQEIEKAREMDLLSYLQSYEPQDLVRVSESTYSTKEHDSLKISNGKWFWFSRGIGGISALDYLVEVKGHSFLEAAGMVLGLNAVPSTNTIKPRKKSEAQKLLMPELNDNTETVESYLRGRGIHSVIIKYCIDNRLLFESKDYHNAVFIGYDNNRVARYGSMRGTSSIFKGELTGSDKHFSFSIPGQSETVHVFESAIDLLSFATLQLFEGHDWHEDHLLSLAGVFVTKRKDVVPLALEQYLHDNAQLHTLRLHLDNDEIGRGAVAGIASGLKDRYQIFDEPPACGKDVNDQLQIRVGLKRKGEYAR